MKNISFLLFSIALILIACGPKISAEQEEKLSQLNQEVDSTYQTIMAVDSNKLIEITNGFAERRDFITKNMSDTISREVAFYLDSFLMMKKGILFLSKEYKPILKESKIVKKQLQDLNHDVQNRLVDEKHFEKYYFLEQDNHMKLKGIVSQIKKAYDIIEEKYFRMLPKVDSIIEASKQKAPRDA